MINRMFGAPKRVFKLDPAKAVAALSAAQKAAGAPSDGRIIGKLSLSR